MSIVVDKKEAWYGLKHHGCERYKKLVIIASHQNLGPLLYEFSFETEWIFQPCCSFSWPSQVKKQSFSGMLDCCWNDSHMPSCKQGKRHTKCTYTMNMIYHRKEMKMKMKMKMKIKCTNEAHEPRHSQWANSSIII